MDTEQPVGRQNIIEHIYKQAPYLNPALRRIAEYVIEHPEQCKSMTIKQLATACGVAEVDGHPLCQRDQPGKLSRTENRHRRNTLLDGRGGDFNAREIRLRGYS